MIDPASQGKKSFERAGNVAFNLFRWLAAKKSRDHHHWNLDGREQVHGHARYGGCADDGDHQAQNNNQIGVLNREAGHYVAGSVRLPLTSLGCTFCPGWNWLRLPITSRSPSA